MTREEERKQAAQAYYPSGSLHEERTVSAFVRGAKWADENQPCMTKMRKDYELLFLLKKRELIKNACDLLYAMLTTQDINDYDYVTSPAYDNVEDFVEYFRKAMEE